MGRLVLQNTLYGFPVQFNVIAFFPFEDAFFSILLNSVDSAGRVTLMYSASCVRVCVSFTVEVSLSSRFSK